MTHHRRAPLSRLCALVLFWTLLVGATSALAQDKAGAKRHFEAGLQLMQSEEFASAAVEFEESLRLYETRSALLNLASCYKALRRYDPALDTLARLERRHGAEMSEELRQAVEELRHSILSSTGTLEIQVSQPGAQVVIDGAILGKSPLPGPVRLAPGDHELEVRFPGMEPHVETVRLLSGQKQKRTANLVPAMEAPQKEARPAVPEPEHLPQEAPDSDPARSKPLLVASLSGTGLAAALGVVAGVLWSAASNQADAYEKSRKNYLALEPESLSAAAESEAWKSLKGEREDAKSKHAAALGLTLGAGAMVAVSAVLWIAWGRSGNKKTSSVAVSPAPGGLAIAF